MAVEFFERILNGVTMRQFTDVWSHLDTKSKRPNDFGLGNSKISINRSRPPK